MNNIQRRRLNAKNISIIGLLGALTAVLGMTPLGFIPIGPTRATIMHIPVIVGSILYGPMVGGFVGLIFGIFSMINALVNMTVVSFVFLNPIIAILPRVLIGIGSYYAYTGIKSIGAQKFKWLLYLICVGIIGYLGYGIFQSIGTNNIFNIVINIVLIIMTIAILYFSIKKYGYESLEVVVASIVGTLINTMGVLSLIYFIYGERFVVAMGEDVEFARKVIFGIGLVNGIPEAIIAIILVTSVCNAVLKRK